MYDVGGVSFIVLFACQLPAVQTQTISLAQLSAFHVACASADSAVGILSPARHFESLCRGDAELVIAGLHRHTQDTTLSVAQAFPSAQKANPGVFYRYCAVGKQNLGALGG